MSGVESDADSLALRRMLASTSGTDAEVSMLRKQASKIQCKISN